MDYFPILKCPFVSQKWIIRQMDGDIVVELTMVSKKFKKLVQSFKLNATKFQWSMSKSYEHRIQIVFGENDRLFHCKVPVRKLTIKRMNLRDLNGQKTLIFRKEYPDAVNLAASSKDKSDVARFEYVQQFTEHLLSIIRIPEFGFSVRTEIARSIDLFNCFIFKITKNFSTFEIISNQSIGDPLELNSDEVKLLFEDLNIKNLILKCPVSREIQHKTPLKQEELHIDNAHFLSFESIRSMNCRKVRMERKLTEVEINDFLKSWMENDSKLKNLKEIIVTYPEINHSTFDREKVIEGTDIQEGNPFPQDHPRNTTRHSQDLWQGNGKDVRNKYNGKLATMFLCTTYFGFEVWDL